MNIFVLDVNQKRAAEMHCDTHCSKMILESAQMLSTASYVASGKLKLFDNGNKKGHCISGALSRIYKPDIRHLRHKCTVWTYESRDNFEWLVELALRLNEEKIYRTGRYHASTDVVKACERYGKYLPEIGLTPFAQAMPEEIRLKSNPVKAYRRYYISDKKHLLEYTRRNPPDWLRKHFEWENF